MFALQLIALTALASPPGALERSRQALAAADFDVALTFAEQAESEAEDARELAEVYRQQGLVREVLGRADHAVVAFARALRCDPTLTLDARTAKRSTAELFALARALHEAGTDVMRVRSSLEPRVGRDATLCRAGAPASPLVAQAPPPSDGVTWPVWTMAGVAVASGATAGVLGTLALAKNADCRNATSGSVYTACDSQAHTLEVGTNAAWTAAGVSAAAALVLWWLAP